MKKNDTKNAFEEAHEVLPPLEEIRNNFFSDLLLAVKKNALIQLRAMRHSKAAILQSEGPIFVDGFIGCLDKTKYLQNLKTSEYSVCCYICAIDILQTALKNKKTYDDQLTAFILALGDSNFLGALGMGEGDATGQIAGK